MTTPATTSSLRDALTPEALTRARRRLLTAHPDPTRANTPTPGSLTDEQLRLLAASDWVPPRIAALDTNTIATADPITRALLAESVRETLERCLAAERPYGTYDDTRAGHDAFSRGLVDDYDHGNHHLARATICPADPGLVTCAGLSALDVPDADADADAPIIDELARASDPNLIVSVLADAACWTLTGTPLGEVCVTRASEPPSWSRHQTNSAWPTPSMPSPRPARHDRSPRTHRRPPLPRSAIFCAPRATGSPHVKRNASVRPSRQMRRISVSTSPTFTGQVREVFHQATPTQGQRLVACLIQRLPACPVP